MNWATRWINLSLRWQIALIAALVLALSLGAGGLLSYRYGRDQLYSLTLDKLEISTRSVASRVNQVIELTRSDVVQTPRFPQIPGIIRCWDAPDKKDPQDMVSTVDLWTKRLESVLAAQMETHPLRRFSLFADIDGKVIARVDREARGKPVIVPSQKLHDIVGESYFESVKGLGRGKLHVSPMTSVNLQNRLTYIATPVFDAEKCRGVFVIALDADRLLRNEIALFEAALTTVVDENGFYLVNPADPASELRGAQYERDQPVRAKQLKLRGKDAVDSFREVIPGSLRHDGVTVLGTYHKVFPDPDDLQHFWAISATAKPAEVERSLNSVAKTFFLMKSSILAVGVILASFAATGLTVSLRKLTSAANQLAAGKLNSEIPEVLAIGEVGQLDTALRSMTANLQSTMQRLQFERSRMQAIFDSTADSLVTINQTGIVQSFNRAAEKFFGYRADQVIGKNVSMLMPSPHREAHDGYIQHYMRTGEARVIGKSRELEAIRSDGSRVPIELRISEMREGDEVVFIGTVQDITKRMHLNQERQRLFGGIRDAVNRLAAACQQILATTTQQAMGAQQQASAMSQTVVTVDELAQTSDQANERARNVAEAAKRSEEVSQAGRRAIDDSIHAMDDMKSQVEAIAEHILSLAERAQAIGEITATVNDIAEQTNVLALNAAVEASRAGEHGKGFAVVASEVKSLAEQSKKATAQVRRILGDIQQATNNAVLSTERGSKAVSSAAEVVTKAGDTIKTLGGTIADSARSAAQISASAGQQAAATAQLREGMKSIERVTTENVLAIQQVQKAAQNLTALSNELAALTGG